MVNGNPIIELIYNKYIILYEVRIIKFITNFVLTNDLLSFSDSNPPTPQTNSNPIIKRGVADDCCLAMCTRRYIKNNYCGPEPELYVSSAQELREMVYVNYNYYYHDLCKYLFKIHHCRSLRM